MKYLVLALVFASALLLGSVPSVGRPTGIILVEHSAGNVTLPDLYCDGRHVMVVTAAAQLNLPAATVGLECNVISLLGTGQVLLLAAGTDKIYDIAGDGAESTVLHVTDIPGASVTLLGMASGNWTLKRVFGDWSSAEG